jgi:hypothetical protein
MVKRRFYFIFTLKKVKSISILFLSFIILASCSDVKKSSQLATIEDLTQKIQSIKQEVVENRADSASSYADKSEQIELRIKHNYFLDTIDMEFGSKMDRHKSMRKALAKLKTRYADVISGCDEMTESLRQLHHDIENGDGDRAKYAEYLNYEKTKFEQLEVLSKEYLESKKVNMATYEELHKELEDFSFKLQDENKKGK